MMRSPSMFSKHVERGSRSSSVGILWLEVSTLSVLMTSVVKKMADPNWPQVEAELGGVLRTP